MSRYLRAEELARLTGVAKSTVLAAIRRGEIEASRTAGRGTRISAASAREYIRSRGGEVPPDLQDERLRAVALLSDNETLGARLRELLPDRIVDAHSPLALALLHLGSSPPAFVVVDLDATRIGPLDLVRSLRRHDLSKSWKVFAIGTDADARRAAADLGAADGGRDIEEFSRRM